MSTIVVILLVVIIVVLVLFAVATYNGLVRRRNEVEAVYGGFEGELFTAESDHLIALARPL